MLRAAAGVCALALTARLVRLRGSRGPEEDAAGERAHRRLLRRRGSSTAATSSFPASPSAAQVDRRRPSSSFDSTSSSNGSPAPGSPPAEEDWEESLPAERHVRRQPDRAVDGPPERRLHRRSAAVARRHAQEQPVPRHSRPRLREAQLVAVGGGRRSSTFHASCSRSSSSQGSVLPSSAAARSPRVRPALERRLGPLDAAAIVISNVIGGGIFFVPVVVAQLVPQPVAMIGVWLVGGALAFAGAMAYAELAALRPRAGRRVRLPARGVRSARRVPDRMDVVRRRFLRRDRGQRRRARRLRRPLHSRGGRHASGLLCARALAQRDAAGHRRADRDRGADRRSTSAGWVRDVCVQNMLGGDQGQRDRPSASRSASRSAAASIANIAAPGDVGPVSFLLALVPVMFSYSGWNAAAYVAEEVRDPGRNVPLALGLGTSIVVVLYVAAERAVCLRDAGRARWPRCPADA